MARVKGVYKPDDHPGLPDETTRQDLSELFEYMFPGLENPVMHGSQGGFAVVAQDPKLALLLVKLGHHVTRKMPWCQRHDLRELAVQTLNLHFRCDFSFQAHLPHSQAAGLNADLLAAIPYWRTTRLFDEEQRLVVEYTFAVVAGVVPDEMFSRVAGKYGEAGAIEFTTAVAWWSFWAMILNATRPDSSPIATTPDPGAA